MSKCMYIAYMTVVKVILENAGTRTKLSILSFPLWLNINTKLSILSFPLWLNINRSTHLESK